MRWITLMLSCLTCLGLSGCGLFAVAPASWEEDTAAKRFEAIPGKALVYMYRDDAFVDHGVVLTSLLIGGQGIGVGTGANQFNVLVCHPGIYELGVTSRTQHDKSTPISVDLQAGSVHYLHEKWEPSYGGFKLVETSAEGAQPAIRKCRLVSALEISPKTR